LQWHQRNQETIFGGTENLKAYRCGNENVAADASDSEGEDDDDDGNEHGGRKGKNKVFLSSSVHGSPRHLKSLSIKALDVVASVGRSCLFITLTVNTEWPEIKSQLLPGQTAFDRPDIVTRVFHARVEAFLHNLKAGKYFGVEAEVLSLLRSIEYQNRGKIINIKLLVLNMCLIIYFSIAGLPHVHIVVKLKGVPTLDRNTEEECSAWIDQHISAAIPPGLAKDDPYFVAIKKHMMHKCAVAENGCKSCKEAICRRGYDSHPIQDSTTFNDRGFPIYKRPTTAGKSIVTVCCLKPDC